MKLWRKSIPFAVTSLVASLSSLAWATPPSTGAYVTDRSNVWVQDQVGDKVGTVNMIMCIISSMRGDAMVNQGPYVALIDENKCQGRGDNSKSTSNNAGASNATNYMFSVIDATQASTNDPLIIKAWLHEEEEDNGTTHKSMIYVYVRATAAPSSTNPNGLFSMYFCGEDMASPGTCLFKGSLQSTSTELRFFNHEIRNGAQDTELTLQNNPAQDSGLGRVRGVDMQGNTPVTFNYAFAYNTSNFLRTDGSTPVCFDRDQANGDVSTWSYGTYNSDGSRLDLANPGFSVKFTYNNETSYGFWGFWGLWLPDSALAHLGQGTLQRRNGDTDETLTVDHFGGKLWRLSRHTSPLDEFKNVSMMYWSHDAIGSGPTDTSYELKWDGSQLSAVGYQQCGGNGCSPTAFNTPVVLSATTLLNANLHVLPVFFPSGGGSGGLKVPQGHDFDGSELVTYRSRDVVDPGSATDLTLHCVSMCPKGGSALTSALSSAPFQDGGVWGPSSAVYDYTFTAASGMLNTGLSTNPNTEVDASGVNKSDMGSNNQWGLTSGSMVDAAQLASIQCDTAGRGASDNGHGTLDHYCTHLIDQVETIYQWETGPNQWNQFYGPRGITISAPMSLSLAASYSNPDTNSTNNIMGSQAADYDGTSVQLQLNGFGNLQGIPGRCVNPADNSSVQCGPNTRWVPAFSIKAGADLNSGAYFVKPLASELRLGKVSSCPALSSAISTAASLGLPDSTLVNVDPKPTIGAEPTPNSPKPAVIDGVVQ